MKLQKEEDKSNFKSLTYRIPSVLAYSLELSLILQIKGPAAKLALKKKKKVGLECKAKKVQGTPAPLSISRSCPLAQTKGLLVPGPTRSSDARRPSPIRGSTTRGA